MEDEVHDYVACRPPDVWGNCMFTVSQEAKTNLQLFIRIQHCLFSTMAFLTVAILLASAAYLIFVCSPKSQKAPAGFRDVPVAGKPSELGPYPQRQWQKWARQHGELFKIRLGWENWVFVNSPGAVKEIFNKQSQHTSSRPPSPIVSDIISGGMR